MRLSSSITRFRGRTDGRAVGGGGWGVVCLHQRICRRPRPNTLSLFWEQICFVFIRHQCVQGTDWAGKNGCSVCVCVHVCCNSCMWYEVRVGGRGRGREQEVCQQNQKQERLIWPDKVDSVTNHSGLWSGQDPRLPEEGQRPANDSTPMDESVYGNKQQSVVRSEGFFFLSFFLQQADGSLGFFCVRIRITFVVIVLM